MILISGTCDIGRGCHKGAASVEVGGACQLSCAGLRLIRKVFLLFMYISRDHVNVVDERLCQ